MMSPVPNQPVAAGETGVTSRSPALGDDDEAVCHLLNVHRPVLLAYTVHLVEGDTARAEDVVRETLLRARRDPRARAADGRWNRSWLLAEVRRILAAQGRGAGPDGDRRIGSHEVRTALSALPERQRSVLVEIFVRERTPAEVAELLRIPLGTVGSRTSQGLLALRAALPRHG